MIFEKLDRVVFAGDSVTDAGSQQPVGEGGTLGDGFVRQIDNMLSIWYPELKIRITNAGHSGAKSSDFLNCFDRDVTEPTPYPNWVAICLGINDVWRQFDCPTQVDQHILPEMYKDNIEQMILKVKGKVKGIFIMTPYIMEPCKEDIMRKRMDEYGAICKELSEKHDCIFIDFQKMYDKYLEHYHSAYVAHDRIHPNQRGAVLMAREFLNHCDFDWNR